ncbi:MAG: mycofactocin oligosaccharide methyltransferase MftM [Lapillicoccus sp.]
MRTTVVSLVDPLGDLVDGRYEDDLGRRRAERARRRGPAVALAPGEFRTPHLTVVPRDGRLLVSYDFPRRAISDDLVGVISDELFDPGWVRGSGTFERILTGVVRSSAADGIDAWELFYRDTLDRFAELEARSERGLPQPPQGSIDGYARVYRHAMALTPPGSTLETGCCYAFLSLLLAERGHDAIASDIAEHTVGLLASVLPRLPGPLRTLRADAARLPLPDRSVDTVHAIHLLEQLDPEHGQRALAEAVRVARRRVVVAVALVDEADEAAGQLRTVTRRDLRQWGQSTGMPFEVHERAGDGWLVVDRD